MRAASKKYSFMTSQILCILGHIIVLTGALVKSTTEVGQMATMGLLNYLNTKVRHPCLLSQYLKLILSIYRDRFFSKIFFHQHFVCVSSVFIPSVYLKCINMNLLFSPLHLLLDGVICSFLLCLFDLPVHL